MYLCRRKRLPMCHLRFNLPIALILLSPVGLLSDHGRCGAEDRAVPGGVDQAAIAEVKSGKRATADASWWGFNPTDATDALQAAIDSGAKKVVVPYKGRPWIVRPIRLRSHLELSFEPGVMLLAKKGEFRGGGDCLLMAMDQEDIKIKGPGAILRMHKTDYQRPPYARAEWRMGIGLYGCRAVQIEGLRIEGTGGDGVMLGSGSNHRPCEDIVIRRCVCDDNHRQGISVVNAARLLIEDCVLSRTKGTPPEAGIDFEPDLPEEQLTDCVVRNCLFQDNNGHGILVYLNQQSSKSRPVSILFDHCVCRMGRAGMTPDDFYDLSMGGWAGMAVEAARDDGPQGSVEFRDCVAENTGREGAKIFDKSAGSVTLRFVHCSWTNAWVSRPRDWAGPRVPVFIGLGNNRRTSRPGGVEFVDCHVYNDVNAPAIEYYDMTRKTPLHDVKGDLTVHGHMVRASLLGTDGVGVTLQVHRAR
jgi:Right handed beta helix region